MLRHIINQLFTSAQHLLLLIIGLHVLTDHSVIFGSLIYCKFQGFVHTFGIPIVFTLKLNPFISVEGTGRGNQCATGSDSNNPTVVQRTGTIPAGPRRDQTKCSTETKQQKVGLKPKKYQLPLPGTKLDPTRRPHPPV